MGQYQGELRISLGLSFPKGIILSAKYFPVNNLAAEIHGGAIPHLMNFGFGFHYHLSRYDAPNTFVSGQMTLMQAWTGNLSDPNDYTAKVFSISLMDFGLGWQNDSDIGRYFVLFGPGLAFVEEYGRHPLYGSLTKEEGIFTPFVDAGIYFPRIN